jgi:proline iminopeptidase
VHAPAAQMLMMAEAQTLDLWPAPSPDDPAALDPAVVAGGRILAHYDRAGYFLAENQLLRDAVALATIPGAIVSGRSDMCTPPRGAFDLAQAWPAARLSIVPAAGHRWSDEMLGRTLVPEIDRLTRLG